MALHLRARGKEELLCSFINTDSDGLVNYISC